MKKSTHGHSTDVYQLKYKICVSGAAETGHCAPDTHKKAEELGRLIAEHGVILVTGATTGLPYWAARGAKDAGGIVIGFSPAVSKLEHLNVYHLPVDYHDLIVYTGFDYSGRNLVLTRSSDAVIVMCGRMGTLNEFTIAFEDQKPLGVLVGTGGMADEVEGIIAKAHRGPGKVVFERDPRTLLEHLLALLEADERKLR